jgi:hypothetical protein
MLTFPQHGTNNNVHKTMLSDGWYWRWWQWHLLHLSFTIKFICFLDAYAKAQTLARTLISCRTHTEHNIQYTIPFRPNSVFARKNGGDLNKLPKDFLFSLSCSMKCCFPLFHSTLHALSRSHRHTHTHTHSGWLIHFPLHSLRCIHRSHADIVENVEE